MLNRSAYGTCPGRNNLELASIESHHFEGVNPKIGGKPPKWMVDYGFSPMNKWMIWGYHYFWKHPSRK